MFSWELNGSIILWFLLTIVEQDSFKHFGKDGLHICSKSEESIAANAQKIHLPYILICTCQWIIMEKAITLLPKTDAGKVVLDILSCSEEDDESGHVQSHPCSVGCSVAPIGWGVSWRQKPIQLLLWHTVTPAQGSGTAGLKLYL